MTFNLRPVSIEHEDWLNECPDCRGNNMHQADVSVYNGDGFDIEFVQETQGTKNVGKTRVTHVMADGTVTTTRVRREHANNPSQDREGLRISFWCEHCDSKPNLVIFQHTGTTLIGWE